MLSKETIKRIEKDAKISCPDDLYIQAERVAYIMGATAEATRYEQERKELVNTLKEMVRCTAVFKDNMLDSDVTLNEHCNAVDKAKELLLKYK